MKNEKLFWKVTFGAFIFRHFVLQTLLASHKYLYTKSDGLWPQIKAHAKKFRPPLVIFPWKIFPWKMIDNFHYSHVNPSLDGDSCILKYILLIWHNYLCKHWFKDTRFNHHFVFSWFTFIILWHRQEGSA